MYKFAVYGKSGICTVGEGASVVRVDGRYSKAVAEHLTSKANSCVAYFPKVHQDILFNFVENYWRDYESGDYYNE